MASQIFNLGKLRFAYQGTYNSSTVYQTNDVVKYNNNLYVYINVGANSGRTPTETDFWAKMIDGYTNPASGTAGQFLQTDGSAFTFANVSQVPSQTGNDGKFLKTNGTIATWSNSFGELGVTGDLTVGVKNSRSVNNKALASNVATLTTSTAHGFTIGESVVVTGVDATFNGTYTITATPSTTTFSYAKVTAGTINSVVTPVGNATINYPNGELYVGNNALEDATLLGTNVVNVITKALTSNVALMTTETNHGFSPFQFVTIDLTPPDAAFDGTYEILECPTAFQFTFAKTTGNISSQATLGTAEALTGYTNPVAVFSSDADDYSQIAFRNASDATNASTDIIVYPNNGTDFSGYIDMGITSSTFDDPEFTITGPNDGYIFMTAPAGTTGAGNLVLATGDLGTENKIIFAAGGLSSNNEQMSITPDQNVHIEIATPSTSSTTGALTVVGGVGVQGDMNVEGDMAIVGNLTFGGGSTTTDNLAVIAPMVFTGTGNDADLVDEGLVVEYATTVSAITNTTVNKALTSNVATLTTATAHTYLVGDIVVVASVDATFNGTYAITSVPSSTTFTYAKTASNVSSTAIVSGTTSVSKRRKFAGAVRDASDGIFKVFKDATTKPSTTVNFSEAGLAYGDLQAAAITGSALTVSGAVSLSGNVDIQEMRETVVPITITSNIATCDWTAGNIYYIGTAPSANYGVAITNVPTDNNRVMTVNLIVSTAATSYSPTGTFSINGTTVTPKYASGSAPAGTAVASRFDVFTYTLIRVGSAWTVFGSANVNYY
jgi:hypothetical protein